ncbi:uncharacterized protein Bfra_009611ia [Botrytis fragariae]|uniref:Phosphatidate phosphatase APP1 catalytic domain-containing protein n=1 Tax=Botrytis fragariae TaxID=1964551 RepID=A0A8H6EFH2_9HELO|nr:uncharacterized protein Bfra_009611ia [Botrytis fragariae]KAF5870228.1 hypothetical protein Bfra_009611ia [Botrytis fragariae]
MVTTLPQVLLALIPVALAFPAPHPVAQPVPHPMITPRASLTDRTPSLVEERGVISSVESSIKGLESYITSVLGTYPSYIASGVPNFFQDFPTGSAVQSSLGISDSDLAATPTQVLNIPGYANWTDQGWNLRVHGNVFKQPNISESKLDDLANIFLVGTSIEDLPAAQQTQARNLTAEIFVVQQANVNVSFSLEPAASQGGDGESGGGGAVTAGGGAQNITLVGQTTVEGDYDQFIQIANVSGPGGYLAPGNDTTDIQRINVYTDGTLTGNATSYLVPESGITIISDIDDILRVTKIYEPEEGLLNSFARPFTQWMNMPDIYANWSRTIPNFHFHYLTTTPSKLQETTCNVSATLSIRKYLLTKIFETYPNRKFILMADTSNSDVMKDYPEMATDFPGQVQCIFLRNTSATDSGDKFPYETSGFQNLNQSQYMFFLVPDDLTNLDIVNGQCYNSTIPQNVTFSLQGLPFGLSKSGAGKSMAIGRSLVWAAMVGAFMLAL